MINRFAPPIENNTKDYVELVCIKTKSKPDDIQTVKSLNKIMKAMVFVETNNIVTDDQLNKAI
jgi:hypothetical protein